MESTDQPTAGVIRLREKYEICLPLFEGPLDLLLHLIRKQEIDIYDIPIALITAQYLDYIRLMQDLNVNVAGEFLEMAATLIYIKSRMLLPVEVTDEDGLLLEEDPRLELVERLLEYEKFKKIAEEMYTRFQVESSMWSVSRVNEVMDDDEPLVAADIIDLMAAYHNLVKRYEDRLALEVEREQITVAEKMQQITEMLRTRKSVRFSKLFTERITRRNLIVLFIAVLELVRMRTVRARQDELFSDIILYRRNKGQ
ncbi:MAG: segregation/condensation protein A [Acidobacteria bacterium]|nr:segregation/condensation protein A [Acidobacteriota bacterium]